MTNEQTPTPTGQDHTMSTISYTIPGRDVCAANVARAVTEYARQEWAAMFEDDKPRYVALPDGGAVRLSALTSTQAAIMPYVLTDTGTLYAPSDKSMTGRGAMLRGDLSPLGDGHAISLVCERARRAQRKHDTN